METGTRDSAKSGWREIAREAGPALVNVALIVGLIFLTARASDLIWDAPTVDPVSNQLRQHTIQIARMKDEVTRLEAEVQALRSRPDQSAIGAQVASLNVSTADLRARQQRLEAAIMDDPARALQVPLLRRDLDNLIAQQVQQVEAQRREVERLYQLVIGLFAALAVAIIAPGLLGIWRSRADGRDGRAGAEM